VGYVNGVNIRHDLRYGGGTPSNVLTGKSRKKPTGRTQEPGRFHHGNLREALIDTALRHPDIEGLSLRQLAAGLGVTAGAAYRHFESRDDLLGVLVRIGFDRLQQRFAAAFKINEAPANAIEARRRLQRLAWSHLTFADNEAAL
jgi:AcrR family transcriptional regulator